MTEFVEDLPDGYETVIGDGGVRLSGGQRQRVAIARALLKDADVLVLDKATSDLDATLEARIHDAIASNANDTLCFVIAHRLWTITDADRIYVMEDGRIVARGDHSRLMNDDGTYRALYETHIEIPWEGSSVSAVDSLSRISSLYARPEFAVLIR